MQEFRKVLAANLVSTFVAARAASWRRLSYWVTGSLTDLKSVCRPDCLTDWQTDWPTTDCLSLWLVVWLTRLLTVCLSDGLIDWLADWLTNQLTDYEFVCLSVCLTVCLSDWLFAWLGDWRTDDLEYLSLWLVCLDSKFDHDRSTGQLNDSRKAHPAEHLFHLRSLEASDSGSSCWAIPRCRGLTVNSATTMSYGIVLKNGVILPWKSAPTSITTQSCKRRYIQNRNALCYQILLKSKWSLCMRLNLALSCTNAQIIF